MQNILKYYHKMVAHDFKSGSDICQASRMLVFLTLSICSVHDRNLCYIIKNNQNILNCKL